MSHKVPFAIDALSDLFFLGKKRLFFFQRLKRPFLAILEGEACGFMVYIFAR